MNDELMLYTPMTCKDIEKTKNIPKPITTIIYRRAKQNIERVWMKIIISILWSMCCEHSKAKQQSNIYHTYSAMRPLPSGSARARVAIDYVITRGAILTWVARAFIDVCSRRKRSDL